MTTTRVDVHELAAQYRTTYRSTLGALKLNGTQGVGDQHIIRSLTDPDLFVSLLYSYDVGTHESGWWRNSEYDRCWHLSMCGLQDHGHEYADLPDTDRRAIAIAVFGERVRLSWWEPPAGENDPYRTSPAARYTHHVRVFTDKNMHAIQPIGEVYTLLPWSDGTSPEKIFRS